MKNIFTQKFNDFQQKAIKHYAELTTKLSVFSEIVNGIPLLSSAEKSNINQYDEKHYFVIPFKLSEYGIALHTMRCLPDGVPEVNKLPKRRVFHFYNEHAEEQLKALLFDQAIETVTEKNAGKTSSLEKLADDIDALDNKLTYGMLLVGGLSALINPLLGATIAAKAILPSATGLLTKHGLKPLGEKSTKAQLHTQIKQAQDAIQKEFTAGSTLKIHNPILQELDLTLRTHESEHDPLVDFDLSSSDISPHDQGAWRNLTLVAIKHVYKAVLADTKKHTDAQLGPEDLRWFKVLFAEID